MPHCHKSNDLTENNNELQRKLISIKKKNCKHLFSFSFFMASRR